MSGRVGGSPRRSRVDPSPGRPPSPPLLHSENPPLLDTDHGPFGLFRKVLRPGYTRFRHTRFPTICPGPDLLDPHHEQVVSPNSGLGRPPELRLRGP